MGLKHAAARGVRWVGLSAGYRMLLMLVRMSIMARLLSPREFGLMGMVTVVLGLAQTYVDMGLPNAVIQKQENDRAKLATLYWMNVLAGITICAAVIALRGPAAAFMREPALADLLVVMAFQLPLVASSRQFVTLLQREMEFRFVGLVQMLSATVAAALAIVLAIKGFGVWALATAALFDAGMSSIAFVTAGGRRWPLQFAFRFREVAAHLRFGMYELGKASIAALATHADTVLVGRYLGANDVGVYSVAKQLVNIPRNRINPVLSTVSLSMFSKQQQQHERMVHALFTVQRSVAYVNLPYLCGLIVVAPVLVPVLYGSRWAAVVPLAQILSVPLLVLAVSGPMQNLRIALGQVAFNFHWAWITGGIQIVAIWYSVQHGLMPLVITRSIVSLLMGIILLELTLRMVGATTRSMATNLKAPALAAALMSAIVAAIYPLTGPLNNILRLGVCVACGAIVFALTALKLDTAFFREHGRLLLAIKK